MENNRIKHTSIKSWIGVFGGIFLVALLILFAIFINKKDQKDEIVAYVDKEPITAQEITLQINTNRAAMSAYFNDRYQAEYNKDFWTTDYNGEVPVDKLFEEALENSINNKLIQMISKEKGLIDTISFKALLDELNKENESREEAIKNNEAVYGPQQYDEQTYYNMKLSNMLSSLKKSFSSEYALTKEELLQKYEEIRDDYKQEDSVKIAKLSVAYGEDSKITREEAKNRMMDINNDLENGSPLDTILKGLSEEVAYEELTLGERETHNISLGHPLLVQKSINLVPGTFSDVFEEKGAFSLTICMERTDNGYQEYESVEEGIKNVIMEEKFNQMIEERRKNTVITLKEEIIEKMKKEFVD
ncbi:MAG: hypothetical protein ACK5JH_05915 [Anaerocolumna sp.]